jgi:hypothetical protein
MFPSGKRLAEVDNKYDPFTFKFLSMLSKKDETVKDAFEVQEASPSDGHESSAGQTEETTNDGVIIFQEEDRAPEGELLPEPEELRIQKAFAAEIEHEEGTVVLHTLTRIESPGSGQIKTRDIGKAQEVTEDIVSAAGAMEDWANAAVNFLSNKKNIANVLKLAQGLAALSGPLGVLSAGLGIVSLFTESDTDKILGAIGQLSDKVDNLQNVMLQQFEKLENLVEYNTAKIQIDEEMEELSALLAIISKYQEAVKKGKAGENDRIAYANDIIHNQTDIYGNVLAIRDQARGNATKVNIFRAAYQESYGDLNAITALGNRLFSICVLGFSAYSLKKSLQREKDGTATVEHLKEDGRRAAELFQPLITDVRDQWNLWSNKCTEEIASNIRTEMNAAILPNLDVSSQVSAAGVLVKKLMEKWFWQDFVVLVYDPVAGLDNHGYRGWNVASWFRQSVKNGKQINLIVKWVPKEYSAEGSTWNTAYQRWELDWDLINRDWWKYFVLREPPPTKRVTRYAENDDWSNVLTMFDSMNTKPSYPGLVWACRVNKNAALAASGPNRVLWKSGSHFTVCFYR